MEINYKLNNIIKKYEKSQKLTTMATKITSYQIHNEKPNKRIASYKMKNRIKDFRNALKGKYPYGECYDDFIDWINSYGLCFNKDPKNDGVYKLELSYGGPADGFVFIGNGYVIKYYFANWHGYKEIELKGSDYETMKEVFDLIKY